MRDLLIEIHTEELPPKTLKKLAMSFLQGIETRLIKEKLSYSKAQYFATPRRLAVLVKRLVSHQPDTILERKGPALAAAFDAEGKYTPACLGFARSCGVMPEQLKRLQTPQGEWMVYREAVSGKPVQEVLTPLIEQTLQTLPVPKRMRWGNGLIEFVRPVHSVIILYGSEMIPATILGIVTDRKTRGHRFHSKGWISIASPGRYIKSLEKKQVLVDFEQRKEKIRALTIEAVKQLAEKTHEDLLPKIEEDLLEEVTGLVEWPVALCGSFDHDFLAVPQEALISAMQDHQRYFPVVNSEGKLQPYFVTISNIDSKRPEQVIAGNERVLRARLADAKFFFEIDMTQSFEDRVESLKKMVFQQKLGTLYDKAKRLEKLTADVAALLRADTLKAAQAGLLAKADLTTQLVGEFPELQGVVGYYCALQLPNDPDNAIAKAILEHYLPKFSGDILPQSLLGCALALADRLDTLIGIFGIQQIPTGDKDPFALRRAAVGVLRILIERQLPLDLRELLAHAFSYYKETLSDASVVESVLTFLMERLKPWYQEQSIGADVYAAVAAIPTSCPYDFHRRIQAVQAFKKLPEANALSSANKRVSNILNKYNDAIMAAAIHPELFEEEAERLLSEQLTVQREKIKTLAQSGQYTEILMRLAALREPIDLFFEKVLVMTDETSRRENRLLLLKQLRELFLYVADIALLQ